MLQACNNDLWGSHSFKAKSEKLCLDVVWMDLANAYGSVPHQIIQLALRMYQVRKDIEVMINEYFSSVWIGSSLMATPQTGSTWTLELPWAVRYPQSLFVMVIEVILKVFMNETTIICSNEDETRRMLEYLDVLMAWCWMQFKPRSLSERKGKISWRRQSQIPTISRKPEEG